MYNKMNTFLLWLVIFSLLGVISCKLSSPCTELKTCGECIGYAAERCVWCAEDVMPSKDRIPAKRCQPEVYKDDQSWCPSSIQNPDSRILASTPREFSNETGKEVQFGPEKMKVKLRPGVKASFEMWYQPALNFPLDMYFLLDNSQSMINYSMELKNQTITIFKELSILTNNVRLGFGSFVDKPALPYSDIRSKNTFVFRNNLPLTDKSDLFKDKMDEYTLADYGSNYDSPEGGLDALMQVMKCNKHIGWRNKIDSDGVQSRKIIILITNAPSHSAGDGKMVGAYKPNDMTCHMNDQFYDLEKSLTLDYPSVSQIDYVARDKNMNIIFAIDNNARIDRRIFGDYTSLAASIKGAKAVNLNGDEIVQIIKDIYLKASRSVQLNVPKRISPNIEVWTSCDGVNSENCKSNLAAPRVNITATIVAKTCNNEVPIFDISAVGLTDKFTVEVEIDCKCECETSTAISEDCSNAGVKNCGVCNCDVDRSGEKCETACSDPESLKVKDKCKEHDSDTSYCNNNGKCVCGKCECTKDFSGKFCQHNNKKCRESCPADRGDCKDAKCICTDLNMWSGPKCECPVPVTQCIGPFSPEVCSGRGSCDCGACKCQEGKGYFGTYCEECKDCTSKLCDQLKDYAECIFDKNTVADCNIKFNGTAVAVAEIMNRTAIELQKSATGCKKKLSNGDILVYKYQTIVDVHTYGDSSGRIKLMVQEEVEKPPVVNIWITIGSVIGGILLVGLLTLIIWKVLTDMYDKREYDKFCSEATRAGFDVTENVLYVGPTMNINNPMYDAKE